MSRMYDRSAWRFALAWLLAMGAAPAAAAGWDAGLEPATIVTADEGADVRQLLRSLATSIDYGLQMSPDVQGVARAHLEKVPVGRALDALLGPLGLGYEVEGRVLIVNRRGLVTRWFTFNYPITAREGQGRFQIDAGREESESGGGGSGGGEAGNQNRSSVSSRSVMAIWPEVMASLQAVVFQGTRVQQRAEEEEQLSLNLADGDGRSLVVNPMASLIRVTAEQERADAVGQLLDRLSESLGRQVAIEVKILEVSLDLDTQTGINWSLFSDERQNASLRTFDSGENIGDQFFQFVVDQTDVSGVLQAIEASGDLKVVSSPRVTTLNNQKAVTRVVTEDVYFEAQVEPALVTNGVATEPVISYVARTVDVGVVLDVTPQVGRDGTITLNVHPTITDVIGVVESPNKDSAPVLTVRELDTVGKVRDGQTLVIAGLISERTQLTRSGIPVLKDLPVLGPLFGKTRDLKSNIELVMLMTPRILEGDAADGEAMAELERMEMRMIMP